MKFNLLLIMALLAGCSTSRVIKSYRVDLVQVGFKCPNDSYFSYNDKLCHYSANKAIKPVSLSVKGSAMVKVLKPKIKAPISCGEVYKLVNKCIGGK